jgi:arylsulfatase A-like enzyme
VKLTTVLIVAGFGLAAALASCHQSPSDEPAIILVTIDTLRADRLSAYGYEKLTTPAIDRLADEGVRINASYADIPWTTGSMASTLTGMYGHLHGLQLPWHRLPEERQTLAEVLTDNGFTTHAIVSIFSLDSAWNLDQGFATYDDEMTAPTFEKLFDNSVDRVEIPETGDLFQHSAEIFKKQRNDAYRPNASTTDIAIDWLRGNHRKKFFLWVHYFGPHERFLASIPEGTRQEQIINDYNRDLATTDKHLGRLLDELDDLGLTQKTLLVLHSDHGQELGDHGHIGHGRDLYEPSVRVPLIIRYPEFVKAGSTLPMVTRNSDIVPTILDFADIQAPAEVSGRSIVPFLAGHSQGSVTRPPEPVANLLDTRLTPPRIVNIPGNGEYFGETQMSGVRSGDWKYLRTTLLAGCVLNPSGYSSGEYGINPSTAIGGTKLPDERCEKTVFEELYNVRMPSLALSAEEANAATEHPDIVAKLRTFVDSALAHRGEAEEFEMTGEQENKLKSLGYLEK